jgi:hypothetical protein
VLGGEDQLAWIVVGRVALGVVFSCAFMIAWDIFVHGYRQQMAIMNAVYPIRALHPASSPG